MNLPCPKWTTIGHPGTCSPIRCKFEVRLGSKGPFLVILANVGGFLQHYG